MPWTHRDFARMHYLYGMNEGDAKAAAAAFRAEYMRKTENMDPPEPGGSNDENLIFPTGIDIVRIHKMYERGELPNENTITGKRLEGETILFSHHEEMKRRIYPEFKPDRLEACKALLKKCEDETFYDNVLWTGTAEIGSDLFSALGYERLYQSDYNDGEDVFFIAWIGLLAGEVIGPFELPDNVTDEVYAKFLKDDLPGLLEDVPLNIREKMWIHVEDKYVGDCVKKFLNENYEGRWIGPNGPIIWPFFGWELNPISKLWGIIMPHVYKDKCDTKEEIMERVIIGCDEYEVYGRGTESDIVANEKDRKLEFLKKWQFCVKEKGGEVPDTCKIRWALRDFARMHYLYGMNEGDAKAAAAAFRAEYMRKIEYMDPPKPGSSNDENLIFPTGVDIVRIHKLYDRGELPNENTITGKRLKGETILFSHHEEMKRRIYPEFKPDRLEACKALLKKCEDETFYDNVLWTGTAEIGSDLFSALGYERLYQSDYNDGEDVFFIAWIGLLAGEVIGPFELPDNVTDEVYAKFLKDDLPGLLEDVPLNIREKMWIHVEDKYVGDCVKKILNENYEGRWIGPNGPIIWPIFGWELNPISKLWGIIMPHVYKDKCDTKEEIMERVIIGCDEYEVYGRGTESDIVANEKDRKLEFLKKWQFCVKEKGGEVPDTCKMPWTHRDFARMHYLYGMNEGDAKAAAAAFRAEYMRKIEYMDPPEPGSSNDENLIFPTGVDIVRIHKMYERGELPNENTITGKRLEGETILFSHHEEMKRRIYPEFKPDRLEACKALLKKCEDETFFDNVLWTGTAEIGSELFCAIGYERLYQSDYNDGEDDYFVGWIGMLAGEVIGPFKFPGEVTGEVYAKFLKDDLPGLLVDVPLNMRKKIWIQIERKYVGDCVEKILNENYEGRWIGVNGPIIWPILGWDLNPISNIWEFVMENVYKDKSGSKEEIMKRVIEGCDKFKVFIRDKESNIFANTKKNWQICVKKKGGEVPDNW